MAIPPGIAKDGPRQFPTGLVNADFFIKYFRDHDEAGHLLSQNREFAFFRALPSLSTANQYEVSDIGRLEGFRVQSCSISTKNEKHIAK